VSDSRRQGHSVITVNPRHPRPNPQSIPVKSQPLNENGIAQLAAISITNNSKDKPRMMNGRNVQEKQKAEKCPPTRYKEDKEEAYDGSEVTGKEGKLDAPGGLPGSLSVTQKQLRERKAERQKTACDDKRIEDDKFIQIKESDHSGDDGNKTFPRPGAVAMRGMAASTSPDDIDDDFDTVVETGMAVSSTDSSQVFAARRSTTPTVVAVPVPDEDPMPDRFEELEVAKQALEQREQMLQETLAENQRKQPGTVSGVAVEMIDKEDSGERTGRKRRLCLSAVLFGVVVLVVSITTGVVLVNKGDGITPPPDGSGASAPSQASISPTVSPEVSNLVEILASEYPGLDMELAFEEGTPQNCAIQWLALEDDWTETAMNDNAPIQMIGERYALAVVSFATIGNDCSYEAVSYLAVECELRSVEDFTSDMLAGIDVSCNDDGFIITLDLGEYKSKHDMIPSMSCSTCLHVFCLLSQGTNVVSGSLPSEVALLSSLQRLTVYGDLSGALPQELFSLKDLSYLDLFGNPLNTTLPSEIGLLTALSYLSLNSLTGLLPSELGLLTALTNLNLQSDFVTGTLPTELGYLTSVSHVRLSSRLLTGTLPSELGSMTSLTRLDLILPALTGRLPSEIGFLTVLYELSLTEASLTGSLPTELGFLTGLTTLDFDSNSLTGTLPSELGLMTTLSSIDLRSNLFNGTLPSELGLLTALKYLDLSSNSFTGPLPSELGFLTVLTYLDLYSNFLTGTLPSELGLMTSLNNFFCSSNLLTGTLPPELSLLTTLYRIDCLNG